MLLQNRQDIGLAQDEQIFALELELGAAILGEEDPVALFHLERCAVAFIVELTAARWR